MSLERSSNLPGGFQVRHHTLASPRGARSSWRFGIPHPGCRNMDCADFHEGESWNRIVPTSAPLLAQSRRLTKDLTIEPYDLTVHEELINNHPLPSAWETPT